MAQMPEIKPEINLNKDSQRDKKGGGLLARLFGGGSGGSGGLGGLGSTAAGGGLLATKAGLIALIVVGTTVAGGIGVVGYHMFGPGQEVSNGENLALFAPKPKDANPDAQAAPKDGTSASLNNLVAGNATPKAAEAPASAAPVDAAASAGAAAASVSRGSSGAINGPAGSGNGVNKVALKGGKFGTLSSGTGGGGGGGSVANVAKPGAAAEASSRGGSGSLGGAMNRGGAAVTGSASHAFASRRSSKAFGQAFGALKDGRGANNMASAGRTFEGSAANGGTAIGGGTDIGGDGAGVSASMATAKDLPNKANDKMTEGGILPPAPPAEPVVPWKKAIDQVRMLLVAAMALVAAAYLLAKTHVKHLWAYIEACAIAITLLGATIIALGASIANGQWPQKTQSGLLIAAGTGVALMGVAMHFMNNEKPADPATDQAAASSATVENNAFVSAANPATEAAPTALGTMAGAGAMGPLFLIGGGMAILGLIGSMMKKPESHPASDMPGGVPDRNFLGSREMPSETALKKMIA